MILLWKRKTLRNGCTLSREKVLTSPLLNTNAEVNKHLEPTHETIQTSLLSNKNLEEQYNMTLINHLYTKINSLKSENIRLQNQVRKLKYRLRHILKIHKTPKKIKRRTKY